MSKSKYAFAEVFWYFDKLKTEFEDFFRSVFWSSVGHLAFLFLKPSHTHPPGYTHSWGLRSPCLQCRRTQLNGLRLLSLHHRSTQVILSYRTRLNLPIFNRSWTMLTTFISHKAVFHIILTHFPIQTQYMMLSRAIPSTWTYVQEITTTTFLPRKWNV